VGDTDTPDFNKARGFLIGFSVVVFLLWYFGADLSSFKLMGNEIKLQSNTKSAWMVLAVINVYFLFRYYQRLPRNGLVFDEVMNSMYDAYLKKFSLLFYKRRLKKLAQEHLSINYPQNSISNFYYDAHVTCYATLQEHKKNDPDTWSGLHSFRRKDRTELRLVVNYTTVDPASNNPSLAGGSAETLSPNILIAMFAKLLTLIRGAFVAPWLSDNVFPLVIGAAATFVAVFKWCQVNFMWT
jgi:hypothetical protein